MAVFDVRGTHGSGKSWLVHQLLKMHRHDDISQGGVQLGYYLPSLGLSVVGTYSNTCGGCDGIKEVNEVVRRVRLFAQTSRHVLLEGILVAHTFKRYSDLATEMSEYGYKFLFLNTPLNTCIARVVARRRRRGDQRPFNPNNLTRDWHCIWHRVRNKCLRAGHEVFVLQYTDPLPRLLELLRQ